MSKLSCQIYSDSKINIFVNSRDWSGCHHVQWCSCLSGTLKILWLHLQQRVFYLYIFPSKWKFSLLAIRELFLTKQSTVGWILFKRHFIEKYLRRNAILPFPSQLIMKCSGVDHEDEMAQFRILSFIINYDIKWPNHIISM